MPLIELSDAVKVVDGYKRRNPDSWSLCNSIRCDIEELSTLSPGEVRGVGKWIKRVKVRENLPEDSDWQYSCSVCGLGDVHNENVNVPFCWHCGAKMEVSEDA